MKKWVKFLLVPLGLLIFVGALTLLNSQLKSLNYADITNALKAIPNYRIGIALLFALFYYILLAGYDIVAFKYIDAQVPLKIKDILFACFISNVLGNNTGYSMLFGGSLRYRLYSIHKVSMIAVTKVLFFSSATIWLGLFAVGGLIFTLDPVSLSGVIPYDISTRSIGLVFLAILTVYIIISALNLKSVKIFKRQITFPNIKIVTSQIILATGDWIVASLVLYMLLPSGEIPYFVLLKVFLVAQLVGILSQVPGGMGVFEASIALLLPQAVSNPAVIGGLVAYRVIFYFFPLSIALSMLGFYEVARIVKRVDEKTKILGKAVSSVIVQVLAISVFFAGMIAIFATATPFDVSQLKSIISLFPKWFIDASYFLLSIISAGLLFTARAIQLRIKSAHKWACVFMSFAILLALIIGKNPLVIAFFVIILGALLLSKKYFYRERSMLNIGFSTWWFCAIAGVFILSGWIGFFINKHFIFYWLKIDEFYSLILSNTDAARFVRAVIAILIIFVVVLLEQMFRKFFKKDIAFDSADIAKIVDTSNYTYAFNAFSSDKKFIINKEKDTFIMYGESGDSLIGLGDPIGVADHKGELLWEFKEKADKQECNLAFIGIDQKYVNFYKDIGLDIFNIGQEAKIELQNFKKDEQYFLELDKDLQGQGFKYEVIGYDDFSKYKETFSKIDTQWQEQTNYIQRTFIPGDYDENYMENMTFGILKKDGDVCAFSVIKATKNKNEISSEIVRYVNCDLKAFTYLVYKNVVWAKEQKYKWFNFGFAYANADIEKDIMKFFAKLFMFSEHFKHDLEKLKAFKDKFNPVWNDKYSATHTDRQIMTFLKNFTILISPKKKIANRRKFYKRFFKR